MPAADLPAEIWAVIALIAAATVIMSLAAMANVHANLKRVRKLREDVWVLREQYKAVLGAFDYVNAPEPEAQSARKAA